MSEQEQRTPDDLLEEARMFVAEQQTGHSLVTQLIDRIERAEMAARLNAETIKARQRSANQRRELRRLNRTQEHMWHGWRRGIQLSDEMTYRKKMIAAFGHKAVQMAERGETQHAEPKRGLFARIFQ
jgi:hypothetical protein